VVLCDYGFGSWSFRAGKYERGLEELMRDLVGFPRATRQGAAGPTAFETKRQIVEAEDRFARPGL
jgi:hypothetical protein